MGPFAAARGESEKPAVLQAAEEARSSAWLRTAHIEFKEERTVPEGGEGPPAPVRVRYYTWKCAADSHITIDHGDEDGVVMRDADGRPRNDLTFHGALHTLVTGDDLWRHVEDAPVADVFGATRTGFFRLHDLRRVGLDPVAPGHDLEAEGQQAGRPPLEYETRREGDLEVVSASDGVGKCEWWIDSQKDWSVVRTTVWLQGKLIGETRFTVAQLDGVWFPQKVEVFRLAAGDLVPSTISTIVSAEFNRPHHPQELTPSEIGVEAGATVRYHDREDASSMVWDGKRPVSPEEFTERVESGEVEWGPTIARERERVKAARAKSEASATQAAAFQAPLDARVFEAQWEAYTRRFIIRYGLDDEQARKAWSVCRECQEKGREHIARRRHDIDEWQKAMDSAALTAGEERERRLVDVQERRKKLMAPVDRIFEERLKPGLERLPTARQREAAEVRSGTDREAGGPQVPPRHSER
jgi:hypothetical protein